MIRLALPSDFEFIYGLYFHPDVKQSGFLRIELSTATINERAIRLYEKTGFQKEGVLRHYTHLKSEGRFLDEVLMSFLLD